MEIVVRLVSKNEDLVVDISEFTTAGSLIDRIIREGLIDAVDQWGVPFSYQLSFRGNGVVLREEELLISLHPQQGSVFLLVPTLVAG